uniref:Carboxypeptidase regulatory-like domain-containing protein n=1 Tax=Pyrodinium bahamense TaxID=73915 RepID=A0A7S0AQG1_9DINO|mmetsp:Transcript_39696/g.110382  ORF Transcript_39696/g.110382 Transcript_39696/m.110382 type:complete len:471 (+) Transcript_39696:312-1724(+)
MPQGFTMTHLHASARVVCKSGFSAAGQPFYELSCQRDGSFSAVTASCQRPLFGVSGRVTDAQSASIKLAGVLITFKVDGYTVAEVTTDSWGLFAAQLPTGPVQVTAAKDGYIESTIDVDVTGTISPGGRADFVLSKVLASGEYRVVLTWAATSRDLDSHTIFGSPSTRTVYFGNKKVTDTVSGLTVTLDRDDTSGWGPETTTFEGVGACKQHCLLVFEVDNWTPYSADIGQSKAVITLYRGSGVEKVWHIPESAGAARIVTIFTVDATEGRVAVYDGEVKAPPSLTEGSSWVGGYESWSYSFDYDTWSKLASGRLLSGLKGNSLSALHKLSYGYYVEVAGSEGMTCQEDDWSGWFDGNEGWQECPVGSYLAGFYRRGNKWDSTVEAGQITRAWCCKPQENPAQWGSCHQVTLFEQAWTKYDCGRNAAGQLTAMVGMHLSEAGVPYNERLSALNKAKCCAFPQMDIITPSR